MSVLLVCGTYNRHRESGKFWRRALDLSENMSEKRQFDFMWGAWRWFICLKIGCNGRVVWTRRLFLEFCESEGSSMLTAIAQSVWRLATDCTVRGSNSDGSWIFPHSSRLALGSNQPSVPGLFPAGKAAGKWRLTTHPHLAPRLKKQ
jgi:hypothetical protein